MLNSQNVHYKILKGESMSSEMSFESPVCSVVLAHAEHSVPNIQ